MKAIAMKSASDHKPHDLLLCFEGQITWKGTDAGDKVMVPTSSHIEFKESLTSELRSSRELVDGLYQQMMIGSTYVQVSPGYLISCYTPGERVSSVVQGSSVHVCGTIVEYSSSADKYMWRMDNTNEVAPLGHSVTPSPIYRYKEGTALMVFDGGDWQDALVLKPPVHSQHLLSVVMVGKDGKLSKVEKEVDLNPFNHTWQELGSKIGFDEAITSYRSHIAVEFRTVTDAITGAFSRS